MFKDALDQMKDDEYICKLHRQINGLKSDIEMVDQQNLSIMKTAEKHKRKAEKLERQNKRYREAWKKAKTEAKEHGAGKADEDITDDGKEEAYMQGAQDMFDDFVYEYERALESESNE